MKIYLPILISLFCSVFILAQEDDPNWVLQEIEGKRQALAERRKIEKSVEPVVRSEYDVRYYGIDLDIDISGGQIIGKTTIRAASKEKSLAEIALDLMSILTVDSIAGAVTEYQHAEDLLTVEFASPVDSGGIFEFVVYYHGNPAAAGLQGFSFSEHEGAPIVSTLSEPYYARGWFPCKDVPSDKADSADIILTVPDSLVAVSNGVLVSVFSRHNGTKTFHWKEGYPITSYLISLAVTNYRTIEQTYTGIDGTTMPVTHWYYPEYESATEILYKTTEMMSYYASLWGEYPFIREKYGNAQFSWGGAMEHQTCTSLGANTYKKTFNELTICHELAHQWWGDMITCADWHNIWLNEGFARYSEALWREHTDGEKGYHDYMNIINRPELWQDGPVYIQNTSSVNSIFNLLVYDKGAWILHMLRHVVGDSTFWNIFRAYRDAHYMGTATTEDFQKICESVSGKSLDWFFRQWVYNTGMPDYKVSWRRRKTGVSNWQLTLVLDQMQSKTNRFKMPVDILVQLENSDTLIVVQDSLLSQEFVFNFNEMPKDITVDPDNWILKTIRYSSIDPDVGYLPDRFLLSVPYPNPFNASVRLSVYLPFDADSKITVYDINGRLVDRIQLYRQKGCSDLEWTPVNLPSGVYVIRLENDWMDFARKIVYLK